MLGIKSYGGKMMNGRGGFRWILAQLRGRFSFLLFSLLFLLIIHPFFMEHPLGSLLLNLLLSIILISGMYTIAEKKFTLHLALILVILTLASRWLGYVYEQNELLLGLGYFFAMAFFVVTTVLILVHIAREREVTANTIYAALSAYLLMALSWAFAFSLLELIQPGSFNFPDKSAVGHHFILARLIYYSHVTITTVGYGDITPKSFPARNFSNVEAIMGQIYMTVLVARLVSLQISNGTKS